jgi:predicted enzyme related to lactoylglutathione lyase
MDKVSHFEIPADDKEESREFYEAIFGWAIKDVPVKSDEGEVMYTTATTTATDPETSAPTEMGGINGALVERGKVKLEAPVITITVDSIEEHLAKLEEHNGKVIEGKQEVPGMGYFAYVEDPAGNVIGLWEDLKK